jgi:transposase
MGKPKRRVNPKVTCRVNRDIHILFLTELIKAVNKLEPPWLRNKRGRPPYNSKVVAVICTFMVAFGHTYDSIESELKNPEMQRLIKESFGVDSLPGHSVIQRGMQKLPMKYIRRLNRKVTRRFMKKRLIAIVDASGFRVKTSSGWYDLRIKRKNKRKDYDKLHIVICQRRGVILDFQITGSNEHDSTKLKSLLREISQILRLIGDAGYLSKKNCEIVVRKGAEPVFAIKKNTKAKPEGPTEWVDMVTFAKENEKGWKEIYHVRSFVEAIFSAIKRRFGENLTAIKKRMRRKQLALKVLAYNIKQALYDELAVTLGVPYWIKVS